MTLTTALKENMLKPIFENIPEEMKELPQWVVWKAEKKRGKDEYAKIPYNAIEKTRASSTNSETWTTFKVAKEVYEKDPNKWGGVGFVLTKEDDIVCIDLDGFDNIDEVPAEFHNLTVTAWTEISTSGTGLHLWVKGKKPETMKSRKGNVECYDNARFIAVTGHIYEGSYKKNILVDGQKLINHIETKFFKTDEKTQKKSPNTKRVETVGSQGNTVALSDSEVIEKLAQHKPKSFKVYQGDFSDYFSHSEAVMALMNDLAFFTGKDPVQMASIFNSSSAVYDNPKENARKLIYTIERAIADTQNVYTQKNYNHSVSSFQVNVQESKTGVSTRKNDDLTQKLQYNENGKIIKNHYNVQTILESDIFKGKIGFDLFRQREVIFDNLPWRKRSLPQLKYEQWKNADDAQLRHYLGYNFGLKGKDMITDALVHVMHNNSFHPVKEYINATVWDKTKRIDSFFIDYLGAEDNEYTRNVARKWFVAAVKRIFEPGCKFDYMPVLVGDQGIGKSTAIQKLAPDFFNDSLRNFDVKESGEILATAWIIEIGELAAMKKSEEEEMKGFISRQVDSYRPAYARTVEDNPRHCVFMGTTNNHTFLKDTTGNRRFLPIEVSDNRKYTPWDDLDEMTVHQLWAEAFQYYRQGESIDLDAEVKVIAKQMQLRHTDSDPREGILEDYLNMKLPTDWDNKTPQQRYEYFKAEKQGSIEREKVCCVEIWQEAFGEFGTPSRLESNKIVGMLKMLGWTPGEKLKTRFKHYNSQRYFVRK